MAPKALKKLAWMVYLEPAQLKSLRQLKKLLRPKKTLAELVREGIDLVTWKYESGLVVRKARPGEEDALR